MSVKAESVQGKEIRAIRGMNDILPDEAAYWRFVEDTAREVLGAYGYREIRPPLLERTELFRRSIGEVTDIVEKEMYTFEDRNGDSLTLRPECTASCVRACVEHSLLRGQAQRLWHVGPMFRHERPQKGRYRQFHQIDVELFGVVGPEADAELILLSARLWRRLGLEGAALDLNTLGSREVQARFRGALVDYFTAHREHLDEDSRRRLDSNPLRILDSKNPEMQPLVEGAPSILDHLDDPARTHLEGLREMLANCNVEPRINPRLVRGLDYYTGPVFEWVSDRLGAQSAICGGGRYDALVEQIGGPPTPATGFAIGLERLVALVRQSEAHVPGPPADAYLCAVGPTPAIAAPALAERLRDAIPSLRVIVDAGEGGFKAKLKRADRSGSRLALILGEQELEAARVGVKDLRRDSEQVSCPQDDLSRLVRELLQTAE